MKTDRAKVKQWKFVVMELFGGKCNPHGETIRPT